MSSFFEKLLPATGLKCVAMALPRGGFRHFFCERLDDALAQVEALDAQGHTVYLAQASFVSDQSRKQENALYLKNFFLDIDCGEGKPYASQKEAVAALKEMLAETRLPFPAVVSSGNGLYAHWFLAEEVPAAQWQTIARLLKKTLHAYGFHADPARTSDSSSVLRPPGSHNRKGEAKRVALLRDAEPIPFLEFIRVLRLAAKKKQVDVAPVQPPKKAQDINADFYTGVEGPRPEADLIAGKCAQIAQLRESRGHADEPLWYAMIGLLSFTCEDEDAADALTHEWSSGHPDYTADATDAKIAQFRATGTGPTTCAHFGATNPEGCLGCRHIGKIKSPVVLGRPEPEQIEVAEEQMLAPAGFRRAEDGLYADDDGKWVRFYDCDLAPVKLATDASVGYEVTIVRHHLPHEGELEFTYRSSLTNDPKAFMTCLADNSVKVVGVREKKMMVAYMESYTQQLQRNRRMAKLLCQMGWREERGEDPFFVLGSKIFRSDGSVEDAALARNIPAAAEGFRAEGSLSAWRDATKVLGQPHMEPFAFALLCGFGAPLMKFTGFDGAMISMAGESGAGKTLMLRFAQSIFGKHSQLMMLRDDTKNALVSRLGVYGTLPLAIDEITNIDGQELSDLVYRVTQGRDKARLTKNSEEKRVLNTWNTLALVSTNSSLIDKLGSLKHDASAEINRVFEYPVVTNPAFQSQTTTDLYWTLDENFGAAGEHYIRHLVTHLRDLKPGIDKIRARVDGDTRMRGEERFWSAIAAAAIYGGLVAKSLGLIQFEVAPVLSWVSKTIRGMRSDKDELTGSAVDILGQFLDEHAASRLLVKGECGPGQPAIPIDTPRGALVIRHEVDNHKLFISRSTFKAWLAKRFGSYTKVANELKAHGALKNANIRKVLGAGTQYGGAQQPCWVIDLKNRHLGAVGLSLVQEAEMLKKGVEK